MNDQAISLGELDAPLARLFSVRGLGPPSARMLEERTSGPSPTERGMISEVVLAVAAEHSLSVDAHVDTLVAIVRRLRELGFDPNTLAMANATHQDSSAEHVLVHVAWLIDQTARRGEPARSGDFRVVRAVLGLVAALRELGADANVPASHPVSLHVVQAIATGTKDGALAVEALSAFVDGPGPKLDWSDPRVGYALGSLPIEAVAWALDRGAPADAVLRRALHTGRLDVADLCTSRGADPSARGDDDRALADFAVDDAGRAWLSRLSIPPVRDTADAERALAAFAPGPVKTVGGAIGAFEGEAEALDLGDRAGDVLRSFVSLWFATPFPAKELSPVAFSRVFGAVDWRRRSVRDALFTLFTPWNPKRGKLLWQRLLELGVPLDVPEVLALACFYGATAEVRAAVRPGAGHVIAETQAPPVDAYGVRRLEARRGTTALACAAAGNQAPIVRFLLDRGAQVSPAPFDRVPHEGPLYFVASAKVTEMLVDAGAKPTDLTRMTTPFDNYASVGFRAHTVSDADVARVLELLHTPCAGEAATETRRRALADLVQKRADPEAFRTILEQYGVPVPKAKAGKKKSAR